MQLGLWKKKMQKRSGIKKKQNSNRLWEILDDIKIHKSGSLLEDPAYKKDFNAFILLRALAMDKDLIQYVNIANEYQGSLSKEDFYKLLIKLIPKTKKRPQWIKNATVDTPEIKDIMSYYGCNRREAMIYYDRFGEEWAEDIGLLTGGLRK